MRVNDFYDHHPISEAQVLAALGRRRGGDLSRLTPDELFEFDQDHYGGLAAVDALARRAGIREWMAATTLQSLPSYHALLGRAGFTAIEAEDLSDEWRRILRRRQEMFGALRADTVARHGDARAREWEQLYAFFVGLVEAGKLGGGRFSGTA